MSTTTTITTTTTQTQRDVKAILNYCVYDENEPERPYKYVYDPPEGTPKMNITMEERPSIIHDVRGTDLEENSLIDVHGFQFVRHEANEKEFLDEEKITNQYYKEIEALIKKEIPSTKRVFIWDHTIRYVYITAKRNEYYPTYFLKFNRRLEEQPDHMAHKTGRGPAVNTPY